MKTATHINQAQAGRLLSRSMRVAGLLLVLVLLVAQHRAWRGLPPTNKRSLTGITHAIQLLSSDKQHAMCKRPKDRPPVMHNWQVKQRKEQPQHLEISQL